MLDNYTHLLPFRSTDIENDVIQMYSLNGTGMAGLFVVAETGNNNPELSAGRFAGAFAASYPGTVSNVWELPRKVRYAASGDNKYKVLGLLLTPTITQDNNGLLSKYDLNRMKAELGIVSSGEAVLIATDGHFRLRGSAYAGTPLPGYVGVINNTQPGKITFVDSAAVVDKSLIVCKALSSSGSAFGGYVDVKLTLK